MRSHLSFPALLSLSILPLLLAPGAAQGQDPDTVRWRNTAELTYLVNGGNSESSTLGFRNVLRRTAPHGEVRLDLRSLRTESTSFERRAVGDADDFRVEEDRERRRTAERYAAELSYDHNFDGAFFWYGSGGWQRNTFAGFRSRTVLSAGVGSRWDREDEWELKTRVGLTYTFQEDVTPDPTRADRFVGLRVMAEHERRLTSGTGLEVKWVVDGNAEELSDVRGDFQQAISASLTDRLALKTTFQLLVDNDPPAERLPLATPAGEETEQTVLVPLGKVDRSFSVALVVTF
jgi:putative salt-induced outer membrane protein YdiY